MSDAAGAGGPVWAVPLGNMLIWQVFDDEFFVYNPASGQTHYLNFLAGEALRSLEADAASTEELVRRLAEQFDIAEDSSSLQLIDRLVRELDDLGLIAPSTS